MIINTRDGLFQGVDEDKNTLSVFSVTNYANTSNKAGILKIGKNHLITPHLINSSPTKKGSWVLELSTRSNLNFTSIEHDIRNCMYDF
jgi:hypothetical protein